MSSESMDPVSASRYQLIGVLDGKKVSFTLWQGNLSVGSLQENDICVPAPTVSRHHAALQVDGERILVRDADSKNGTWVNGVRITESEVRSGDTIAFAAAVFQVARVDEDDAVLAIVGERRTVTSEPRPHDDQHTKTTARRSTDQPPSWIEVLDGLARCLLTGEQPDLAGGLHAFVGGLGASGGVIAEFPRRGEPVVVAATGQMTMRLSAPEVSQRMAHARVEASASDGFATFLMDEPVPLSCAAAFPKVGLPLLLGVTGTFHRRLASPELMSLALRIILARRPDAGVLIGPAASDDALPDIVIPEGSVLCRSTAMHAVYDQIRSLSQGDIPVLITGETGAGKEHIARILHASSRHAAGPFIVVNCAAIPSELLEAELFGIERGVATGVDARQGKFQLAHNGTIFLDEIADMSADLQAKLLRALEQMEVNPLGAKVPVPVNVRVISATNADLEKRIAERKFRRDLYFRLAGFLLRIPPLRERRDDIAPLVEHFMRRYAAEIGKPIRGITVKALRLLTEAPWPGNVRELEHEVRRLVYLCPPNQAIDSGMLSESVLAPTLSMDTSAPDPALDLNLDHHTAELERKLIRLALGRTHGNITRTAELLGLSRNGLKKRMTRYGIEAATE